MSDILTSEIFDHLESDPAPADRNNIDLLRYEIELDPNTAQRPRRVTTDEHMAVVIQPPHEATDPAPRDSWTSFLGKILDNGGDGTGQDAKYSKDRSVADQAPTTTNGPAADGGGRGGLPPDIGRSGAYEDPEEPEDSGGPHIEPNTEREIDEARRAAARDFIQGIIPDDQTLREILEAIEERRQQPSTTEGQTDDTNALADTVLDLPPVTKELIRPYTLEEANYAVADICSQALAIPPAERNPAMISGAIRDVIENTPGFDLKQTSREGFNQLLEKFNYHLMHGKPDSDTAEIAHRLLWRYWPK